jgi:hypothetical protein
MTPHPPSDWQHLAEQASKETDPNKLMKLVSELCSALDSERKQKSHLNQPAPFPAD